MRNTALDSWYEPRRAAYPWRANPEPYGVLVSEVMLQQTQISRVLPAYLGFMAAFPTVEALAAAPLDDVLRAWRGLGYNRRAAALWRAAGTVVGEHGGTVPSDAASLSRLPGVGPYTAAAVACFAFGEPVAALDTNVRRVVARHRLAAEPPDAGAAAVRRAAASWLDRADPAGWNAALMDLGREVCRPKPRCARCPLRRSCRFHLSGRVPGPPRRRSRSASPFQGSMRQLRGRIIDALCSSTTASIGQLASRWGETKERVEQAVTALMSEGLIEGSPDGRLRLAGSEAAFGGRR